ncbi:MAG: sigma-54 dependent transcriptional regulator [Devosiaceae bacterium]|nr:sigma-54 dependent transcriptional regulator [Devosiaceae bacterium]
MNIEVLFVDDEEDLRRAVGQMLDLAGLKSRILSSANTALALISHDFAGIIVSDIRMEQLNGMELLKQVVKIDKELPVLLVTGHGDVNLAVNAMRDGAYDFIEKPFSQERFLDAINRAIEKRRLTLENRQLRNSINIKNDDLDNLIIGNSATMQTIKNQIRTIAQSSSDILIIGDTGTGKELSARAIHSLSPNKASPFIAINCAALPHDMIERELFGYEAGAFSGASRARFGKFEHGRNGTIFLDEIISLPQNVQAKLLRVIEENSITRLGSNEAIALNARFIASSSIDLEQAANEGNFRKDLLYRLNVITLKMPTLKQRQEDIVGLFIYLTKQAAIRLHQEPPSISDNLISSLNHKEWPGNVRELQNFAERYVMGIENDISEQETIKHGVLSKRIAAVERQIIANELVAQSGRLKATYEALGISRKSLYEKMQKHNLSSKDFKKKI